LQVQAVELAVGVVEHGSARDLQYFAGGSKFLAPQCPQFPIVTRAAAMSGRLPRRQADDAGFNAALAIKT
jgi:hypothetical protein